MVSLQLFSTIRVTHCPFPVSTKVERLLEQLDLDEKHIGAEGKKQLRELLTDVFALDAGELGTTSVTTHTIDTGDHPPIRQPMHWTPFALNKE